MLVVSEEACRRLITPALALEAVEAVFAAMARGDARNFPVIREALGHADALYGFKSGFDASAMLLGLKSGGYWPGNVARGLTNHQSVVALFDPDTGQARALVGGNHLTALRTAAASAVSIKHLARPDARVLGIIGAGHQAPFQLRAAAAVRAFERVVAWNRDAAKLDRLEAAARDCGLAFEPADRKRVGAEADVIITITSCFEPLMMRDWVRPGTHIAAMGTDTQGKQELDPELVSAASVFTDEVAQSVAIGEAQHAVKAGLLRADAIVPIGAVINGDHAGRSGADEITLFDGTGVGLQDLAVAGAAVEKAEAAGLAARVAL